MCHGKVQASLACILVPRCLCGLEQPSPSHPHIKQLQKSAAVLTGASGSVQGHVLSLWSSTCRSGGSHGARSHDIESLMSTLMRVPESGATVRVAGWSRVHRSWVGEKTQVGFSGSDPRPRGGGLCHAEARSPPSLRISSPFFSLFCMRIKPREVLPLSYISSSFHYLFIY